MLVALEPGVMELDINFLSIHITSDRWFGQFIFFVSSLKCGKLDIISTHLSFIAPVKRSYQLGGFPCK